MRLHNENYERVKQSCIDVMKELTDSIIPWTTNQEEMSKDFEKLWENKCSKVLTIKRKEIDQ